MHECYLCEKKETCLLDKKVHDLWLKQIRLSNIRKVLLVTSSKNGLGASLFSSLLAKKLSDFGYKTAYLEASFAASLADYLVDLDNYELIVSNKGIIPFRTIYNYNYMSPLFFMGDGYQIINWDNQSILKFIEKIIINTNWEGVDTLIIDLPFNNIDLVPSLKEFFVNKLESSLLFVHDTNKNVLDYLKFFENTLNPISILLSPLSIKTKKNNIKNDNLIKLPFVNDFYKKNTNSNKILNNLELAYSDILKKITERCLSGF